MTKKYKLLIVDIKDPNLKLEQLADKTCQKISFNSSNSSKKLESKLDRIVRKLMDKNNPYLAIYLKAEKANANVAVIEEKNEYSIKASLYSVPGINPHFPTQLFEGAFNVDYISKKYLLAKSLSYR